MLVGSGGGSISVESAALDTMAGQIASVAGGTGSTRGSVAGAAGAADGCENPAARSYALLQSLLAGALACLDEAAQSLSRATSGASVAYQTTDVTQMPMSVRSCPAAP
jgi:hypothetical protein